MLELKKTMPRLTCSRCCRPQSYCLCTYAHGVLNRTKVLILQHPDEHKHPLNTARLAMLSLQNAELLIGESFPQLNEILRAFELRFLLFPAKENNLVQPLQALLDTDAALLIVPDGTWRNVRKLIQLNPILATLPHLSLPIGQPSEYKVRKASETAAVSTIEAIVRTLSVLEPDQDFTGVLRPFHALVEQQIHAMGADVYKRNYRC